VQVNLSSPLTLKGATNGALVSGLPEREGLTAGFFIPEIAQTFREKASLSSTVGGEREPTNSMYRSTNLDMCSMPSSLFFLREIGYPNRSDRIGGHRE
jgi:hypothetical protein